MGYYPDNHRPQTAQELKDTINYAIYTWCDGLMKINKGRINSFDIIDEAIDSKATLENGMYDLKHSTEKIFWQDILGSENYVPVVSKVASEALNTLLDNLVATGKLIRLSNFDITYQDATGVNVAADKITDDQRQKLADYYAYVIRSYMNKIPHEKQAGLCKGNMADTTYPVGLWSVDKKSKDWVRTATYKAFCDALSGE